MAIELYNHNKKAYENVLETFRSNNKTCVVHATGTGKSFISLKFLEDNKDKMCLFLCPTYSIIDQVKRHIIESGCSLEEFPNLDFEIYRNITGEENYDCIVLDEFHRVGGKEWGKSIYNLLSKNSEAKILGVSATPIRYLDDNRNMADEIFEGNIASEISLADAIVRDLLPAPTYITSIYSFESEVTNIQEKIDKYKNEKEKEELQKRLDLAKKEIERAEGLEEVFFKNIENQKGKFIVFCKTIDHMKRVQEEAKKWFSKVNSNIHISAISSAESKEINEYTITRFENDKSDSLKLLFSVEMLNEGVHVKDIDGVIMLRPTQSPIIYQQQLGRALSVGHNDNPLIFDIVNNYSCLDVIHDLFEEVKEKIRYIREERQNGINADNYPDNDKLDEILDRFKIIEKHKDINEILATLKNDSIFSWNDWYELAKVYYEKNYNLEVPYRFKTLNGYEYDKEGVALGNWVRKQRETFKGEGTYKPLSDEQIKLLNDIGMRWGTIDSMDVWMEKYELAQVYYKKYQNLEIPASFKTINGYDYDERGILLGSWLCNQRTALKGQGTYKPLSDEQIKLLNDIGMRWKIIDAWMEKYELAKIYYEKHQNLEIPQKFKTINGYEYNQEGISLGSWLRDQRTAFNQKNLSCTVEQIKLLSNIGMRWTLIDKMDAWMEKYELAKIYYEKHQNLEIPQKFKTINGYEYNQEGISLGNWIMEQRKSFKGRGTGASFSDEQIKLLNDIGMTWFTENIDKKLQSEIITEKNKLNKQKEIYNRFRTLLNQLQGENINKQDINDQFIKQLNRKR